MSEHNNTRRIQRCHIKFNRKDFAGRETGRNSNNLGNIIVNCTIDESKRNGFNQVNWEFCPADKFRINKTIRRARIHKGSERVGKEVGSKGNDERLQIRKSGCVESKSLYPRSVNAVIRPGAQRTGH